MLLNRILISILSCIATSRSFMDQIALVYGGAGALGSTLVSTLIKHSWRVVSVDLSENSQATFNVRVSPKDQFCDQSVQLHKSIGDFLKESKFQAIYCVAGGWSGGNASDKNFVSSCELMYQQSVQSSVISASLATGYLRPGGLVVFTGAKAALSGTPGMIGYGMAKAAVHHLTKSLAQEQSGLPSGARVCAILPVTLDTPNNRKWMPNADHSQWTPMDILSEYNVLRNWGSNPEKMGPSGSLIKVETMQGKTIFNRE